MLALVIVTALLPDYQHKIITSQSALTWPHVRLEEAQEEEEEKG